MADEKKSKNDKLYDHSSSKKGAGEKKPDKKAEPKGEEKKPEGDKGDAKPEGQAEPGAKTTAEKHAEERESLFKAQRNERRDLHGNHRSEHDQMNARQEEAIKAVVDKHLAEIAAESAAGAAAAPPAGGADVAAAAAAAPQTAGA